jgi:hypothetical protein
MKIKYLLRLCTHFLVAVIFAFFLASLLHSQFVIAELIKVGVEVSFTDRLSMSFDDLLGLTPTYSIVIAISFLLAFSVAGLLGKYLQVNKLFLYGLAGGLSIAVALLAMYPILEITLLASARSSFGFACQCVAGAVGGGIFAHLRKNRRD